MPIQDDLKDSLEKLRDTLGESDVSSNTPAVESAQEAVPVDSGPIDSGGESLDWFESFYQLLPETGQGVIVLIGLATVSWFVCYKAIPQTATLAKEKGSILKVPSIFGRLLLLAIFPASIWLVLWANTPEALQWLRWWIVIFASLLGILSGFKWGYDKFAEKLKIMRDYLRTVKIVKDTKGEPSDELAEREQA